MTQRMTAQLGGLALLVGSGLLLLSVSACEIVPPPVPGQPMTAEQKALANQEAQREMHDRRRQERPCGPNDCMNR
ncbi:MAG TPA: hypothetical protein VHA35_16680 [Dongiaceae bacterium]|nr:hypothetical protein [Dongiaceae bacterium]